MARIRTIKPEICSSSQFVECSTNARLLFVLSWCFFDDGGVHHDDAMRLKMEVFPGDSFTKKQIEEFIQELVRVRLWARFVHENDKYIYVTGWKHQKIDRPSYKFPGPLNPTFKDQIRLQFDECSTNVRRSIDDDSPPEGKGMEGKGKDLSIVLNGHARFDEWWTKLPKQMRIAKKRCVEIWRRKHLDDDADELIADVAERMQKDQKWIDGFAPTAPTYLNQERWEDEYQRMKQ